MSQSMLAPASSCDWKRAVGWSVLAAFIAISLLVYSPWHQHASGKGAARACTLSHFECCAGDADGFASVPLAPPQPHFCIDLALVHVSPAGVFVPTRQGRAPPAV